MNRINIENGTHQQLIRRIIASGDDVQLLIVDKKTDDHYTRQGITVTAAMPEVQHLDSGLGKSRMDSWLRI